MATKKKAGGWLNRYTEGEDTAILTLDGTSGHQRTELAKALAARFGNRTPEGILQRFAKLIRKKKTVRKKKTAQQKQIRQKARTGQAKKTSSFVPREDGPDVIFPFDKWDVAISEKGIYLFKK